MITKPLHCALCPLYRSGQGFSTPEGTGKNGILILGEALGKNEAADAKPFRPWAESGSILEQALSRLGLNRLDFALYNIVNCQPPNNKLENMPYEQDAAERCSHYVRQVVEKFKPKVILSLGNVSLKYTWKEYPDLVKKIRNTVGLSKQEVRSHLKKLSNTNVRGYSLPSVWGIPVISSLHPSFIRRTGVVYLGTLIRDIRLAVLLSQGKLPPFTHDYKNNPDEFYLNSVYNYLYSNPTLPLSYDIETPYTTLEADEKDIEYRNIPVRDMDSIQFSHKKGEAFFLSLGGAKEKGLNENWEWAKKFLSLPNPKIGFNSWEFDDTNIKFHFGEEYPINGSVDEMWMAKFWNQDFGASKLTSHGLSLAWTTSYLQEGVPVWKHLSNDDPFLYGNIDADVTLRNFLLLEKEFKARRMTTDCFGKSVTHTKTIWEGFQDDIVSLNPILKAASKRGFPIDVKGREEFKIRLRAEIKRVNKDLQAKYPNELLNRKPVKGYANTPKEVEEIRRIFGRIERLASNESSFVVVSNNGSDADVYHNGDSLSHNKLFQTVVERLTRNNKKSETGLVLRKFKLDSGVIQERWCRLENFKVGSKPQVLAYIEHKGYKLKQKKNKTSHKMEVSTSKDVITQLYEETRDKFLGNIVYLRELQKLLSTYVGEKKVVSKKSTWQIEDIDNEGVGVVRTTFGYWPVSGQLSSTNPNIHNFPKYGSQWNSEEYVQWAKDFRKTVKAREGRMLLEFDYKSYHALTTAFEAEDADYARLVRLDIHSYFAAHIIRNGFPIELQKIKSQLMFLKGTSDKRNKLLKRMEVIQESLDFIKDLAVWLAYDDAELKKRLRWIKDNHEFIRNRMAKPTILGIPYGMGPGRLYEENIRSFENKEQASTLLNLIQKLFPKIFSWQSKIRQEADKKGFLISRYGYLQRFYNVYDYRPLKEKRREGWNETIFLGNDNRWWSKKPGSDSENVVSFYPQNDAFGKIKEAIRDCDEVGYLERYGFCNTIHDSLMFECEIPLIEECAKNVKEIMERPARHLVNSLAPEGLICQVDVSIGRNWGAFDPNHPEKNPEGLREMR